MDEGLVVEEVGSVVVEKGVDAVGRLDENLDGVGLIWKKMDEGLVVEEVGSVVVEKGVDAVGGLEEDLD
ncbi:hypothetical protein DAPPUDRAFT_256947 [Daphnia pulex]|uniref:Uncharacterized protein n=1 Tax=Daphnia pulex TaxID=6669 RepID=E9HCJ7_DAPPU|nr:hypothetical protein DAPPUDRAFT_256947 [Daphnia pulex]|eukprot:EFX70484.1 hypothetical protein DAPPUDRAFT_256947 [Daphnia pulex]